MKKYRSAISVISFVMFVVSAVTGLVIFFGPHGSHGAPNVADAARAAKSAVEAGGISFMLIMKKTHEYASVAMVFVIFTHIWMNWNSLKSYMIRK